MAGTWQPNEEAYGPGGGQYVDDAGQIWPDPWGALNTPPAVASNAPSMAGGGFEVRTGFDTSARSENMPPAPMTPAAPAAPQLGTLPGFTQDPEHPDIQTFQGSGPNMPPTPSPGFADKGGASSGAPPAPQPGIADTLQSSSSSSSSSSESGSSGLSDEAQARQGKNISQVAQGMAGARD